LCVETGGTQNDCDEREAAPMNPRLFHGRDRGVFRGGVKAGTSNDRQHTLQSVVNRWAGMLKGQYVLGPKFKDVERPKIVTGKAQTQPEVISLAFR